MKSINKKNLLIPSAMTPCEVVTFNEELCIGCNKCVNVCRTDVLMPNTDRGKEPIVVFPDECWFCGCCVDDCPIEDAICMHHPLNQKIAWKRKETGEIFRVL